MYSVLESEGERENKVCIKVKAERSFGGGACIVARYGDER